MVGLYFYRFRVLLTHLHTLPTLDARRYFLLSISQARSLFVDQSALALLCQVVGKI